MVNGSAGGTYFIGRRTSQPLPVEVLIENWAFTFSCHPTLSHVRNYAEMIIYFLVPFQFPLPAENTHKKKLSAQLLEEVGKEETQAVLSLRLLSNLES